jgi:hypothetical protein
MRRRKVKFFELTAGRMQLQAVIMRDNRKYLQIRQFCGNVKSPASCASQGLERTLRGCPAISRCGGAGQDRNVIQNRRDMP